VAVCQRTPHALAFRGMKPALAFLALLLCVAGLADAQAIDRAKLVGQWENAGDGFTQTQSFRADGTFDVVIKSDVALMNRQESGKWELNGAMLKLTVEKSTTEGRAGKSASFRIHKLTDDELVIQRGPQNPDETVTLKRVK
jgi:uncharacterized protein (TIGR03066 family)